MPNIADLDPTQLSTSPPDSVAGPAPASEGIQTPAVSGNIADLDPSALQTEDQFNQEQYGGFPQQILAGIEGGAQGLIGPVAPALEEASGLTSAEDIRGRAAAHPWAHGIGEGAGFVGSALIPGLQEASLAGVAGNIGEHAVGLLPEATGLLPKIAETGVKTGAEMAALQSSDELSKMVTNDPNQSLGTAAINIGLSGILGGVGGAALGSVSPLWDKAANRLGIQKLASDYMGEMAFPKPGDMADNATAELNDRMASTDKLMRGGLKNDLVEKLAQDVKPENLDQHVTDVQSLLDNAPKALQESPVFQDAVESWKQKVTPQIDPLTLQPTFQPKAADVFNATQNLKRQMQEIAEPLYRGSDISVSDRPLVYGASNLAAPLADTLENTSVWGAAGQAQKDFNKAISPLFDIQKEARKSFMSKLEGEYVADPKKLNSFLSQTEKGKAGLRTNYMSNYLDQTDNAFDTVNNLYNANQMEPPFDDRVNPARTIRHLLNTEPTAGVKMARWVKHNGAASLAANAAGHVGAEVAGGSLGFLVGHPMLGAWMGDKILKPVFTAIAKPLAEKSIDSVAARSATDYIGNIIKGQKILGEAVSNFFKPGALVIGKDLIPDSASRDKLKKSLEYAQNPQNLLNAGGSLGHYLPDHATAAAATASQASNYFAALKPKQQQPGMLDDPTPIDKGAEANYNRALDVAQQPLLVLQYAKKGTLLPQDVQTLETVYPGLKQAISQKISDELVTAKANGTEIPYKQRLGLAAILGQPVDATMTQPAMATIMAANSTAVSAQPQVKEKKPSGSSIAAMQKLNKIYATPEQARAASRTDMS